MTRWAIRKLRLLPVVFSGFRCKVPLFRGHRSFELMKTLGAILPTPGEIGLHPRKITWTCHETMKPSKTWALKMMKTQWHTANLMTKLVTRDSVTRQSSFAVEGRRMDWETDKGFMKPLGNRLWITDSHKPRPRNQEVGFDVYELSTWCNDLKDELDHRSVACSDVATDQGMLTHSRTWMGTCASETHFCSRVKSCQNLVFPPVFPLNPAIDAWACTSPEIGLVCSVASKKTRAVIFVGAVSFIAWLAGMMKITCVVPKCSLWACCPFA